MNKTITSIRKGKGRSSRPLSNVLGDAGGDSIGAEADAAAGGVAAVGVVHAEQNYHTLYGDSSDDESPDHDDGASTYGYELAESYDALEQPLAVRPRVVPSRVLQVISIHNRC